MINRRRVGIAVVAVTTAVLVGCQRIPDPRQDVAVLVLDQFTPAERPRDRAGNCAFTVPGDKVGSGGGGGPSDTLHGKVVFGVLQSALAARTRLVRDPDQPLRDEIAQDENVKDIVLESASWRDKGHVIFALGVDTSHFDTGEITENLDKAKRFMRDRHGITRFVINMSFYIAPCDADKWLRKHRYATEEELFESYLDMTNRPEFERLHDALEATRSVANLRRDYHEVFDLLNFQLFYSQLAALDPKAEPRPTPRDLDIAMAAWNAINDDRLKSYLDGNEMIPVGASGTSIRLRADGTGNEAWRPLPFSMAPGVWDAVVSVSASDGSNTSKADYSNGGEVMMDDSNEHKAQGTSFAAPKLSALEALYLFNGGGTRCDGHRPPLGYNDWDGPTVQHLQSYLNLWLSAAPVQGDPALGKCKDFLNLAR